MLPHKKKITRLRTAHVAVDHSPLHPRARKVVALEPLADKVGKLLNKRKPLSVGSRGTVERPASGVTASYAPRSNPGGFMAGIVQARTKLQPSEVIVISS